MQHQVLYQVYIYLTKPCTCRPEAIILIMHILSSQDDLEKYLLSLVKLCSNLKIQKRDCIPWTEKSSIPICIGNWQAWSFLIHKSTIYLSFLHICMSTSVRFFWHISIFYICVLVHICLFCGWYTFIYEYNYIILRVNLHLYISTSTFF